MKFTVTVLFVETTGFSEAPTISNLPSNALPSAAAVPAVIDLLNISDFFVPYTTLSFAVKYLLQSIVTSFEVNVTLAVIFS